jgi:imidazole glycerol phosphate synthase subunit HisF
LNEKKNALHAEFTATVEVPLVASGEAGTSHQIQDRSLKTGSQQSTSRTMNWHANGGDHNLKTK